MFVETMKSFYDSNGYLVVEELFNDEELGPIRQRTDEIVESPDSAPEGVSIGREGDTVGSKSGGDAANKTIRGTAFLARFDPVFQDFARHPKMLEIVRGLLGGRIKLFRDQMLLKPPGGQAKPLHQDQSYFRVQPQDDLVTAWCALDDATLDNGCMCYVPGSQKYGIFEVTNDPERPVHHIPDTSDIDLNEPVQCPVPAGSVIFHHGCTLHNSNTNNTETWRRAVILHYTTKSAASESDRLNEEVSLEID